MGKLKPCPKCGGRFEEGHVIDEGYGTRHVPRWQPGAPHRNWFLGLKVNKKALKAMSTNRCMKCGYIEFYAK